MDDNSTTQFDFDDWAGLYLENPQEFEARRKAALMIELTRGSPEQCAAGRAILETYEKRVQGCDTQERLRVAASMMAESARQLGTEWKMLKLELEKLELQEQN
ncbi:MAG: hypothetical protein AB8B63_09370 [Granulosicoccus sp.]